MDTKKKLPNDMISEKIRDELIKYQSEKRKTIERLDDERAIADDARAFGCRMVIHECKVDLINLDRLLKMFVAHG